MGQSPYAPPASHVSDPPDAQQLFPKPKQVRIAVGLLWLSLVVYIPTLYFEYRQLPSYGELILFTILVSAILGFAAFLNVKISKGRNWARIVFLALVAISLLSYLVPDGGTRAVTSIESALSIIASALDVVALYLLFSWPGALWFRPRT